MTEYKIETHGDVTIVTDGDGGCLHRPASGAEIYFAAQAEEARAELARVVKQAEDDEMVIRQEHMVMGNSLAMALAYLSNMLSAPRMWQESVRTFLFDTMKLQRHSFISRRGVSPIEGTVNPEEVEKLTTCAGCGLKAADETSVMPRGDGIVRCNSCMKRGLPRVLTPEQHAGIGAGGGDDDPTGTILDTPGPWRWRKEGNRVYLVSPSGAAASPSYLTMILKDAGLVVVEQKDLKVSEEERAILDEMRAADITLSVTPGEQVPTFRYKYQEERVCTMELKRRAVKKDKLKEAVKKAMDVFNALSPAAQEAHRREQAISWAHGQMLMSRSEHGKPDLSKEDEDKLRRDIEKIYDRIEKGE